MYFSKSQSPTLLVATTQGIVVGAIVGIVILVCVGCLLFQQWQSQMAQHPNSLWKEICEAHGLTHSQRRLLQALAAKLGAKQPSMFAVNPELLDRASTEPTLTDQQIEQLQSIRQQLFHTLPTH